MFCCCAPEDQGSAAVIDATPTLAGNERFSPKQDSQSPQSASPAEPERLAEGHLFTARLDRLRPEEPLGLKVDFADERCMHICKVPADEGKPVDRYNASVPEDQQIRAGDYFVTVNGKSAESIAQEGGAMKVSDVLRMELQRPLSVELVVSRPNLFEVTVVRNGKPMGLDLTYSNAGLSLIINGVSEGAVRNCTSEVVAGDRIVAVNGVEGSPQKLLQTIAEASQETILRISRPFTP